VQPDTGLLGNGGVSGVSTPAVWPDARSLWDGRVGVKPTPTV
jgi:hypothetical protein